MVLQVEVGIFRMFLVMLFKVQFLGLFLYSKDVGKVQLIFYCFGLKLCYFYMLVRVSYVICDVWGLENRGYIDGY